MVMDAERARSQGIFCWRMPSAVEVTKQQPPLPLPLPKEPKDVDQVCVLVNCEL
jgi:hypothetical protein